MKTELEKLTETLFGDPTKQIKNFNVWWGPEANQLSPEERAKVINDVLEQVDELVDNPPVTGRQKSYPKD